MPQAANKSISNGTTSITFTPVGPVKLGKAAERFVFSNAHPNTNAGDKTLACWSVRNPASMRNNLQVRVPYVVQDSSGAYSAQKVIIVNVEAVVPVGVPPSLVSEALSLMSNAAIEAGVAETLATGHPFF